jgi:Flp pilus assembly protein TadG
MMSITTSTLRRLAVEDRGAEIAEAAAVLPVMFTILIGIFWFGQAFSIYGTITRAAQEGARAAVAPLCTTCSGSNDPSTNAFNAIQNAMTAAHLDPTQMKPLATTPSLTYCSAGGAAACDTSQTKICVQGVSHTGGGQLQVNLVQLSSTTSVPGVCGVSVSFRYPFRFPLPFVSVSNQQIWLQAQAEVRAEMSQ